MRTSSGPMTVMTANGEVRTNKEATENVKQLDYFVTVMLLQETPAVLSLGENSAKNMGIRIIGKAVRIHLSSKTARELIAIYPTMYHLWFLEYQRVLPPLRFHLPLHHLHHRIQYLMLTDIQKILHQKEVEVRVKSFGETAA